MKTMPFLFIVVATASACSSGSTGGAASGPVTGAWRATVDTATTQRAEIWHFYEDGRVDWLQTVKANGATTTVCRANTADSHWDYEANKLRVRFGNEEEELLYEITEGGTRLHLAIPSAWSAQTPQNEGFASPSTDTYERASDVTDDCHDVETRR